LPELVWKEHQEEAASHRQGLGNPDAINGRLSPLGTLREGGQSRRPGWADRIASQRGWVEQKSSILSLWMSPFIDHKYDGFTSKLPRGYGGREVSKEGNM